MRWFAPALLTFLFLPRAAHACLPIIHLNDREKLAAEIRSLDHATAAFEGVVEREGLDVGSLAVIRPTRIWFGPRLSRYVVKRVTMCDRSFGAGERVKVVLYDVQPDDIPWWRFWDWMRFPGPWYRTPDDWNLDWALRQKPMQDALRLRARRWDR